MTDINKIKSNMNTLFSCIHLPLSLVNLEGETIYCCPRQVSYIVSPPVAKYIFSIFEDINVPSWYPKIRFNKQNIMSGLLNVDSDLLLIVGPVCSQNISLSDLSSIYDETIDKKHLYPVFNIIEQFSGINMTQFVSSMSIIGQIFSSGYFPPEDILMHCFPEKPPVISDSEYVRPIVDENIAYTEIINAIQADANVSDMFNYYINHLNLLSCCKNPCESYLMLRDYTYKLCELVADSHHPAKKPSICNDIDNYIGQHYKEPITAQDVADACSISRRKLYNIFTKWYKTGVYEYINTERLRVAAYLLKATDKEIKEIASLAGFCNSSKLSFSFKKHYGLTPTEYRNNPLL